MYPEIRIGSIAVPTYPVMVMLGLVAAGVVKLAFPVPKLDGGRSEFVLFPGVVGLFVGAKLPVLVSYGLRPEFLFTGRSLLGALVGAYLAVRLAKWLHGLHWVGGGDGYVLPITMGLAFGRTGCLLNGCCWGAGGVPVPAFEIAFHLVWFFVFLEFRRRRLLVGSWFPLYLLAYCVFRFAMEFIRTEPRIWLGLTVYHGIALAGTCVLSAELAYRWKLKPTANHDGCVSG